MLFIFHCCRGFRGVVEEYAVDACDFGGDAFYKMVDQGVRQMLDGDFHHVGGVDGADDTRPVESSLAVLYAGRLEIRNDGEILPYLAFKAVLCEFFAKDSIGFTDCLKSVAGDGAGAAYAEAGPGKG